MSEGQISPSDVVDSLREAGVPMARDLMAMTVAEGMAFVEEIGFPVVLKGNVPGVTHKSDLGLVYTGIDDEVAFVRTFDQVADRLDELGGGRVMVQEGAAPGAELLLSARRIPQVGVLLTVGIGGSLVEVVSKIAVRLCPAGPEDILDMLEELEMGHHLDNWRGVGALDVGSFVDAAVSLGSWMIDDANAAWSEIEINPVIVHVAGSGCTAVDLVVEP